MHDQAQFDTIQAFLKAACELLQSIVSRFPPPKQRAPLLMLPYGDCVRFKPGYRWLHWLQKFRAELQALPEHPPALSALQRDQGLTRHLAHWPGAPSHQAILNELLRAQVERQDSLSFDPLIFEGLYQEMVADFESPKFVFRLLAPLAGFSMATDAPETPDRLEIEPNLNLVRLSRQDLELYQDGQDSLLSPTAVWAIETRVIALKPNFWLGSDSERPVAGIYKLFLLLNLLRIFQTGNLSIDYYSVMMPVWSIRALPTWHYQAPHAYHWSQQEFVFKIEHQRAFIQFWHRSQRNILEKSFANQSLKAACHQFIALYSSYDCRTDEQRLMALLKVPKALLLRYREDSEELFNLRWSYLLAVDSEHRKRIRLFLRLAFQFRQQIVSGSAPTLQDKPYSLRDFNDTLAALVRGILRVFILSPSQKHEILARLEKSIRRDST